MSDTDQTPKDAPDDKGAKPDTGDDGKDYKSEAEKWKALARKHEAQAKANADAAKKLQEFEDADKSEAQKAADRAAAAEKRAEEAELRALRLEVAADKGLTITQAKRISGKTREELEADADEFLESIRSSEGDQSKPPSKPRENLRGGSDPTESSPDSADQVFGDLVAKQLA